MRARGTTVRGGCASTKIFHCSKPGSCWQKSSHRVLRALNLCRKRCPARSVEEDRNEDEDLDEQNLDEKGRSLPGGTDRSDVSDDCPRRSRGHHSAAYHHYQHP